MAPVIIKDKKLTASFRLAEMRCRCRRKECTAPPMDPSFMIKLQRLRDLWGKPLLINSGARCAYWNQHVHGSPTSLHMLGKAADVHLESPTEGPKLSALAEKAGLGGIGVGLSLIHVDDGPAGRRWTYDY